ncbi:MAG: phosphotransferase family protein [Gammaproteobacteria bacterium]
MSHTRPIDKNQPTPEWIESLRTRFPCEPEVDRFLTAKLNERSGSPFKPVALNELCEGLGILLRAHGVNDFEIRSPRWLTGGASKLQMAFDLEWAPTANARVDTPMVLRMQPAESIVESSRLREFQLLKAMSGCVPVPAGYWVDNLGDYLPYPALVCGFVDGVTKPTQGVGGEVSGMGTHYGERLRGQLAPQFVDMLARIHTFEWDPAALRAFEIPTTGTQVVERQINWWRRVAEEDALADIPILKLAEQWLIANMPPADRISLLHGDYRCGNFLFNESTAEITAWLDWELGHLGDRHEDLAWSTIRTWGHVDPASGDDLVCGLIPEPQFLASYENASGLTVNPETLLYYKVLNTWKLVVMSQFSAYRVASRGKTHQDVLVAWCIGISAKFNEQLTELLDEVL